MAQQGPSPDPPLQLATLDSLKSEIEMVDMDPPGAGQVVAGGGGGPVLRVPGQGPAAAAAPVRTMRHLPNPMLQHPLEAVALESAGKPKVEDKVKVIFGPQCWKCFGWETWWKCQACEKSYHKRCAFFGAAFPHPIFNLGVEEAIDAAKGVAVMVKCTQCSLAESPVITRLSHVPLNDLNQIFGNVASLVEKQFRTIMPEIHKKDENLASLAMIRDTILYYPGHYKTLEAFSADYRLIKFQFIRRFGIESEESEVIASVLRFVKNELNVAVACWECYLRRYDHNQLGRLVPATAFYRISEASCRAPHPLIWAQIPEYSSSYWPAKLLFVDEVTGKSCFHCFEEKAVRFEKEGVKLSFYGKKDPNEDKEQRRRKSQSQVQLSKAVLSCGKYLGNLRQRFGADSVVIQEESGPFSGSYARAFEKMFPSLNMQSLLAGTPEASTTNN